MKGDKIVKSSKRYSNVGITKRVDHEAGRHHSPRAAAEPAVCGSCGAVYAGRRWMSAGKAQESPKHKNFRPSKITTCPACKLIKSAAPAGFLHLKGQFLAEHRAEIERLLKAEARRASDDNPLGKIMDWKQDGEELIVTTTTEHLAKRLGRALEKACSGEVRYDFSHENKLARVYWQRDLPVDGRTPTQKKRGV